MSAAASIAAASALRVARSAKRSRSSHLALHSFCVFAQSRFEIATYHLGSNALMRLASGTRFARTYATLAICACAQPSKPSLTLHDVPSDGNCLFSSVALSAALVDGDATQARARAVRNAAARLRSDTMDLLCPTGTPDPELALGGLPVTLLIEPAAGENEAGYCRRLRQPGQWGSTTEILALTKLLGRPVTVHTEFGAPETYGADEPGAVLDIHFEANHYRAVTVSRKDEL